MNLKTFTRIVVWSALGLMGTPLWAESPIADPGPILVWDIQAESGADEARAKVWNELPKALLDLTGRTMTTAQERFAEETVKPSCSNRDTVCIMDVMSKHGLATALTGTIARNENGMLLVLEMAIIQTVPERKSASERIMEGDLDALAKALPGLLAKLFKDITPPITETTLPAAGTGSGNTIISGPTNGMGLLVLQVVPADAEVWVDRKKIEKTADSKEPFSMELPPGDYRVEVCKSGFDCEKQSVLISAGASSVVIQNLRKRIPWSDEKIAGTTLLSFGLSTMVFMGVPATAIAWETAYNWRSGIDSRKENHLASDIATSAWVIGGAATVTGILLFVLGPSDTEREMQHHSVSIAPMPDGNGAAFSLSGRW